ncbi:MAG: PhzF family phenazine biosynthesis protein, partial [Bacteroidales bacterium]|nr:PhzF family phenazine biosynthesis protein [Bacteroidales bacterium]
AFLFPEEDRLNIRFFTPATEIDLCGHATLSASHILYETGRYNPGDTITLYSKAGELRITTDRGWIKMNFPAYDFKPEPVPSGFRQIVGAQAAEYFSSAYGWKLALMNNEGEVRSLEPDFPAMKKSDFGDLIVTAPSPGSTYDFVVRCFAPALGIDEDPVTGSAHCALTPFWSERLKKKELVSHQVSRRGGILKVSLSGERVDIAGQAVTIMKSELFV